MTRYKYEVIIDTDCETVLLTNGAMQCVLEDALRKMYHPRIAVQTISLGKRRKVKHPLTCYDFDTR